MTKLFNAFSLQMISINQETNITVVPLSISEVKNTLQNGFESYIGHTDTANVLSNILDMTIPFNRQFGAIQTNDTAIIAQVVGGRLPEGATTIPQGIEIEFYKIII